MSKRNNVNPDHYKLAGRDRPGDAVAHTAGGPGKARRPGGVGTAGWAGRAGGRQNVGGRNRTTRTGK
jgi:hypothetical protein